MNLTEKQTNTIFFAIAPITLCIICFGCLTINGLIEITLERERNKVKIESERTKQMEFQLEMKKLTFK